jgi:hypothetical protein
MVDGIRLFLADSLNRGIGFMDFPQNSLFYHFSNSAEVYDWDYSLDKKQPAIRDISFDPVHNSGQDGSGSLKAVCHFAGSDSNEANIGTVFDHLPLRSCRHELLSQNIYYFDGQLDRG